MATAIITRCAGGGHVHLVFSEAGIPDIHISLNSADILDRKYSVLKEMPLRDADLVMQVIGVVKAIVGTKTVAKIKTAVEAATYTVMDENT